MPKDRCGAHSDSCPQTSSSTPKSFTTTGDGPNDLFEIAGNSSPDPPDDDDEVHEPQDYTGDYPLESDDGEDEE